ncbi:hypothetical protein ACFX2I_036091 [Malus domestica]
MGRSLVSPQKFLSEFLKYSDQLYCPIDQMRSLCTKAVLSGIPSQELYVKVGAKSTGPIPIGQLVGVVEKAPKTGAKVVMDAVNKPRNITSKGLMDLVTE